MDATSIIIDIVLLMREFQRQHNVRGKCVNNTQYMLEVIKLLRISNAKAKAVYVFSNALELQATIFIGAHVVIELDDGTIIDPSYEIDNLKHKVYFDNIKTFIGKFDDIEKAKLMKGIDVKQLIREHLRSVQLAEEMNTGKFIITDENYYKAQADYVMEHNDFIRMIESSSKI